MTLWCKLRRAKRAKVISYLPVVEALEERIVLDDNSAGGNGMGAAAVVST